MTVTEKGETRRGKRAAQVAAVLRPTTTGPIQVGLGMSDKWIAQGLIGPMNFIKRFRSRSYHKLGPTGLIMFWLAVTAIVLAVGFGTSSWWQGREIEKLIEAKSKSELPELERRFPGGFVTFGVLTGGSATAGHAIIRSSTSYNIDVTWGDAAITELTPRCLTLQLQNIRIVRTETTPSGARPAGAIQINGAAIWRIDRGSKLVYVNNALAFWGYALGGFLISDTDDVVVVAMGLQRIEGT